MIFGLHWTLIVIAAGVAWAALAYWRPGSVALAASWCIAQAWFYFSGDQLPFGLYRVLDILVIAALFFQQRASLDWFIMLIFPIQWWVYGWGDETAAWWTLWTLAMLQMLLAGPWPAYQRIKGSVSHGPRRRYVGEV